MAYHQQQRLRPKCANMTVKNPKRNLETNFFNNAQFLSVHPLSVRGMTELVLVQWNAALVTKDITGLNVITVLEYTKNRNTFR